MNRAEDLSSWNCGFQPRQKKERREGNEGCQISLTGTEKPLSISCQNTYGAELSPYPSFVSLSLSLSPDPPSANKLFHQLTSSISNLHLHLLVVLHSSTVQLRYLVQ